MSRLKAMDWNAFHKANKADGPANILAIGTANPANVHRQNEYPDFYFRATNSHHMTGLKKKFQRICEKSAIETRHMYICEDILKDNPQMCTFEAPSSLETRLQMALVQLPELAKEAALKAIKEWGQPKSKITHLVFHTTIGVDMPGADFALIKLLGLNPDVKRVMLYEQGCFAGGTALRIAKDLAENNRGARVLAVCSEITAIMFRGPHEDNMDNLVGQALFGDGAGAMIVGSDPVPQLDKPCFEIWWAEQTILSDTPGGALPIEGNLSHAGLSLHIIKELPDIISTNMERILETALEQFGVSDWNELFWVAHPGGRAILDAIERKLKLNEEKLSSSREVLSEYGNMASACVIFVLDRMRKRSMEKGCATTGQGLDWGVFLGFGPGVTVEALVLKSVPTSL